MQLVQPLDGLPSGVTGTYSAGLFTISGTPGTASGSPFSYTVTATSESAATATATGTINVDAVPTIDITSAPGTDLQTVCINTAINDITYSIGGSANDASVSGLPTGVSALFSAGTLTISGSPSITTGSPFSYIATTSGVGVCPAVTATGTIAVDAVPTISLTSLPETTSQTVCINTAITDITYAVGGGATGATLSGQPAGVTGTYNGGTFTISGSPSVSTASPLTYTVTTTGGVCTALTATGTIDVNELQTANAGAALAEICQGRTSVALGGSVGGSAHTGTWSSDKGGTFTPNANDLNATWTPTPYFTGIATLTLTSHDGGVCGEVTASKTQVVGGICDPITLGQPAEIVTEASGNSPICSGGTTAITLSSPLSTNAIFWTTSVESGTASGNLPGTGTSIAQTLINTGNTVAIVRYTATGSDANCTGTPLIIDVTVNPRPSVITTQAATACSGSAFLVSPANGGGNIVPAGTTYSWSAPSVSGGLSGGASGSGATIRCYTTSGVVTATYTVLSGTLVNPTSTTQTATYTVTPTSGDCIGSDFTVTITVDPKPFIASQTDEVCSEAGFTVAPTDGSGNIIPAGTTYSWLAPSG